MHVENENTIVEFVYIKQRYDLQLLVHPLFGYVYARSEQSGIL